MLKTRRPVAVVAAGAVALCSGCITFFSKTDVVRSDECRRAVRFENEDAATAFHKTLKAHPPKVAGGAYVGVPFVTLYHRDKVMGEAAAFNDAVARCDTDQDSIITLAEAQIYEKNAD